MESQMIDLNHTFRLATTLTLPGDKSLSHRALILGALAEGETSISNLLKSHDLESTLRVLRQLGVSISQNESKWIISGVKTLSPPLQPLDCGNSGTTLRLMTGLLSAQPFETTLTGDESLSARPMDRVKTPLERMGARILLRDGRFSPVKVLPCSGRLLGVSYSPPVASAQVKSAILLAGLFAKGETVVIEPTPTRDHTERLLRYFGAKVDQEESRISLAGGQKLFGRPITIPNDPSSAAFLIAAALIQNQSIELQNVLLNPGRIGFMRVMRRMGAQIQTSLTQELPEPVGTVRVTPSRLLGTQISKEEVPSLIDELPVLAILGAYCEGSLSVEGASELRVKETDRIRALAQNFARLGVPFEERADGFEVTGGHPFRPAVIEPSGDHRIAMAFAVGALGSSALIQIRDPECSSVSFPGFFSNFERSVLT